MSGCDLFNAGKTDLVIKEAISWELMDSALFTLSEIEQFTALCCFILNVPNYGVYKCRALYSSDSLSGNKGLCGVPTLPACALFWEKGGLNKTGKIALGASFGFLLLIIFIVVYILCIRRGPYDYDFEFPQDLTSISAISAKRNRYQRAKSVMLAEMEAHSPDGFYTNGSPH
ncbi:hypothetical protein U9M48_020676 [Paspalum notatum var. saurae]|uniref:Uncharacterized protein n=1 Tax=Paspalum notatum var. saurae TaxID=547442 RepID=A0AAQ3TI00_PASNO